LTALHTNMWLL